MSGHDDEWGEHDEAAPGDEHAGGSGFKEIQIYLLGLLLAVGLTVASFWIAGSNLVWGPGIPAALLALAVAQIGVHLVFFLHITSGQENTNNTLALAFGVLIVLLVVVGSVWIMAHLNHNMMPMDQLMRMQK
jgi:cytochrome o ubiquinol oxidase operon protein cyoD